jgi:putative tryptophan/tyrosine transport system substrate-binding protein
VIPFSILDFRFRIGRKRQTSFCLTLLVLLFAISLPLNAQQPKKVPRVRYVLGTGQAGRSNDEAFRRGLRDLGYIIGETILIEYRDSEGNADRIPGLVAELIQLKVDVLVAIPTSSIRAAKQATKTIPIVMVTTADPIATKLVDSLARPGGNITGVTRLSRDLNGKRLELLKEAVPITSRVGVLLQADSTSGDIHLKEYETAARALKMQLQSLRVHAQKADFEEAFQAAAKGRMNALITIRNGFTAVYGKRIADLAIKIRLPSMYESSNFVEAGGLVSYSANEAESFTRAAWYVDKILKGSKPSDLPVEQPTKFELAINLRTAKQIGLAIPPQVLARADKVIK